MNILLLIADTLRDPRFWMDCGAVAVVLGIVAVVSFVAGLRRGRELAAMELPAHAAMHFQDGPIVETRAWSASEAIDRLIAKSAAMARQSLPVGQR